MSDFSYNISDRLLATLSKIDEKRIKILTTSISPKDELRIRWEAQVDRIHSSFLLSGLQITKQEIVKIFRQGKNKNLTGVEQRIIDYRNAFNYLNQNWLVTKKSISVKTVLNISSLFIKKNKFRINEEKTRSLLEFMQASREHCVIMSGIIFIQFLEIVGTGVNEEILTRLLSYLFLYRAGYDFRGLLKIEEVLIKDKNNYSAWLEKTLQTKNLTLWLEYYAEKLNDSIEEVLKNIEAVHFHLDVPAKYWELNDRQREILNVLDVPDKSITNRIVQKLFNVSQITASRDLAGLASLGIIYPHGKGRSVYYTKV